MSRVPGTEVPIFFARDTTAISDFHSAISLLLSDRRHVSTLSVLSNLECAAARDYALLTSPR